MSPVHHYYFYVPNFLLIILWTVKCDLCFLFCCVQESTLIEITFIRPFHVCLHTDKITSCSSAYIVLCESIPIKIHEWVKARPSLINQVNLEDCQCPCIPSLNFAITFGPKLKTTYANTTVRGTSVLFSHHTWMYMHVSHKWAVQVICTIPEWRGWSVKWSH